MRTEGDTAHWKGEDVPLRSEASFRVERATMRNLVREGIEWLEVEGPQSRRRIHITMARRMATVQGMHVLIPWRCWQRIDNQSRPTEDAYTEDVPVLSSRQKKMAAAGQMEIG